ncbi:MAG TPA: MBL fold metallo-hydrolase [Steroidobacteraceae bacterium]|nr:MBL fold metallo-hydrolase [Steroidobacteraceae bacterium]
MKLTFCGAARQVTGSCFYFETERARFLVDCGLFQGNHDTRAQNYAPFAFDPRQLDFVILTHAHLDHSGLLPKLSGAGFEGPIYTTPATKELLGVLLPDSAYLQQMEAERAARHGREFVAVYGQQEVTMVLRQVKPVPYDFSFQPTPQVRVCLRDAGHILGSAVVELWIAEGAGTRKVVVSGDLGQPSRPILRDPAVITDADILLLESTYGDRDHKPLAQTLDELVASLERGLAANRGVVLVPAFAVGRTQEFLYYLNQLTRDGRLPDLTVFVDSPMAAEVTRITARHLELFDEEARRLAQKGAARGKASVHLSFTQSVADSMALNRLQSGAIIVAASGMCDGGRIRHHLKHHLANPHATVLIIGFQAAGTLGRRLVDGAQSVRIMGEDVPVRAEIVTLGGFSAHADQSALTAWAREFKRPPAMTYLVHGEEKSAAALGEHLRANLRWRTALPAPAETVTL